MSRYETLVEVATPEDARARVLALVTELCRDDSCPIQPVLERCVADSVDRHWGSAVRNFVPVIAFRDVRTCIERGWCSEPAAGHAP